MTTAINNITDGDLEDFSHNAHLSEYQRIATKSAIYPGQGTIFGFSYCAHKLAGEAGELNEHFGKAMRDDGIFEIIKPVSSLTNGRGEAIDTRYEIVVKPLTVARRQFLIKEIGDCLWYLSALCNELGITLAHAAWINLVKLKKRSDENKLQGSGDDR